MSDPVTKGTSPIRPQSGPLPSSAVCPHCATELDADSRFCEVCGYDPSTGSLPQPPEIRPASVLSEPSSPSPSPSPSSAGASAAQEPAPTPASRPPVPVGRLVAVITADRAYYDSHDIAEVQFPLGVPPRTIELPPGPVSIGRRSRSRGTNPAIDLAGPPEDPAVSHTHASLLPGDDGIWQLVDHGSTNGTYLNESPEPVAANRPLPLADGDRIYLGAWTRITIEVHPPAP